MDQNNEIKTSQVETKGKSLKVLSVLTILVSFAFLVTIAGLWYLNNKEVNNSSDIAYEVSEEGGEVLGASTEDPVKLTKLAENLKAAGFMFYGFDTDSKTIKQKESFGQAYSVLDYVECDPKASHSNADECVARGIEKYPTWVRGETLYPGYKSPVELEQLLEATK